MMCKVKLLHPMAKTPTYAHDGDAAADLYAVERTIIIPGETVVVRTGIALELPDGFEAQIRPRSSQSRNGISVLFGTIDSGYRGEIGATIANLYREPHDDEELLSVLIINPGDRIAQMVIAPVTRATFALAENLSPSSRGEKGWGSSGR